MLYPLSILSIFLLLLIHLTHGHETHDHHDHAGHTHTKHAKLPKDTISASIRAHWIRRANLALHEIESPCPFGAFGTAIVNHTDLSTGPEGKLLCIGVNDVKSGNPILHGETQAINNCSAIFVAKKEDGGLGLSGQEAGEAWKDLSLYTNGEPCPMCATVIRWAGFKEAIYSTSAKTLRKQGWPQMDISIEEVFARSKHLKPETRLVKHVLANESDSYFAWQFDAKGDCPKGCGRTEDGTSCVPGEDGEAKRDEL